MAEKFSAIIIDDEIQSRMRLKQVTSSVHSFGKVLQVNSFKEALEKIRSGESCDVIFMAYKLGETEMREFVKMGKSLPQGQDSAYILVLPPSDGNSTQLAANMLSGVDGQLFEPYSVDSLVEITNLAQKVRKERSSAREKAAIALVIGELVGAIDEIAAYMSNSVDYSRQMKKVKDLTEVLNGLSPEAVQAYYDLARKTFMDASSNNAFLGKMKYKGVSNRLKKKMLEKSAKTEDVAK